MNTNQIIALLLFSFWAGGYVHAALISWIVYGASSLAYSAFWPLNGIAATAKGREWVIEVSGLKEHFQMQERLRESKNQSEDNVLGLLDMVRGIVTDTEERADRVEARANDAHARCEAILDLYVNDLDGVSSGAVLDECKVLYLSSGGAEDEWTPVERVIKHALVSRANEVTLPLLTIAAGFLASKVDREDALEYVHIAVSEGMEKLMEHAGVEVWDRVSAASETSESLDKDGKVGSIEKEGDNLN